MHLLLFQDDLFLNELICVCVRVVCVYVGVCISFYRKGFSWLNKAKKCNARVQVSDGMLRKYFCIKYLCRHIINNHSRTLQAENCAKEYLLNRVKSREVKESSYKLSKTQR